MEFPYTFSEQIYLSMAGDVNSYTQSKLVCCPLVLVPQSSPLFRVILTATAPLTLDTYPPGKGVSSWVSNYCLLFLSTKELSQTTKQFKQHAID